jgi:hypothetical protein
MRSLEVDNRGNVAVIMALVTTAIVLMVASIVLGKMAGLSTTIFPGVVNSTGWANTAHADYQAFEMINNVSGLAASGMSITAIGLLVLAALGILSYFGIGFGGKKGK